MCPSRASPKPSCESLCVVTQLTKRAGVQPAHAGQGRLGGAHSKIGRGRCGGLLCVSVCAAPCASVCAALCSVCAMPCASVCAALRIRLCRPARPSAPPCASVCAGPVPIRLHPVFLSDTPCVLRVCICCIKR